MIYIIDIVFTRKPKGNFENYTCEINHRGYKIRRYIFNYTFVELLHYIGYLYYNKINIVRLAQNGKIIIDEFKGEY